MGIPVKGTMHGKTIELEKRLPFPEGSVLLISVEPLQISNEEQRDRLFELSGAWKDDPSIKVVFEEIARERRNHRGREVSIG